MQVSIQLGKIVKPELTKRGLIKAMAEHTGLERHTISSLIHGTCKYVSLEAIGKICDFLIDRKMVDDPSTLPAALFGREPDEFLNMLASCQRLEFCIGVRSGNNGHEPHFVAASDSHLHGMLLSAISRFEIEGQGSARTGRSRVPHYIPPPHLVPSPATGAVDDSHAEWVKGTRRANTICDEFEQCGGGGALLALGSVKVNPVIELMLAEAFDTNPFESQDMVDEPTDRSCPVLFRYRRKRDGHDHDDPEPPSCIGGIQLASGTPADTQGIYYETEDGSWACCPSDGKQRDTAFVFYDCRPNLHSVKLAIGGFSGEATICVAAKIGQVVDRLWPPQLDTPERKVGLFMVEILYDDDAMSDLFESIRSFKLNVIPLDKSVVMRRLDPDWPGPQTQNKRKKKRTRKTKATEKSSQPTQGIDRS